MFFLLNIPVGCQVVLGVWQVQYDQPVNQGGQQDHCGDYQQLHGRHLPHGVLPGVLLQFLFEQLVMLLPCQAKLERITIITSYSSAYCLQTSLGTSSKVLYFPRMSSESSSLSECLADTFLYLGSSTFCFGACNHKFFNKNIFSITYCSPQYCTQ